MSARVLLGYGVSGDITADSSHRVRRGREGSDFAKRLKRVKVPTLVVWGGDDRGVSVAHGETVRARHGRLPSHQ